MESAQQYISCLLSDGRVETPVKNTFIHFNFGLENAGEAQAQSAKMRRSASDPIDLDEKNQAQQSSLSSLPLVLPQKIDLHHVSASEDASSTRSHDMAGSVSGEAGEVFSVEGLDPTLASVGAAGHNEQLCKPCAWNWKPGGCVKGRSCTFCHLCEEGELKRRKKDHIAVLRARKVEKRLMAGADASSDASSSVSFASRTSSALSQQQARMQQQQQQPQQQIPKRTTPPTAATGPKQGHPFKMSL